MWLLFLCFAVGSVSALELPIILASDMVLPSPNVTFWGKAQENSTISISITRGSASPIRKQTLADAKGKWQVRMLVPPSMELAEVIVAGDGTTIKLERVMFGDVILCSGKYIYIYILCQFCCKLCQLYQSLLA